MAKLFSKKKFSIEFYPMIRLSDKPSAKRRNQWHSVHTKLENPRLEAMRQGALSRGMPLRVTPDSAVIYNESADLLEIKPDIFYLPGNSNQVALDSFIIHSSHLYIFQFTVSSSHDIKTGLVDFLKKCKKLPSKDKWFFIFIVMDDVDTLKCPVPTGELQDVKLYSTVLKVV